MKTYDWTQEAIDEYVEALKEIKRIARKIDGFTVSGADLTNRKEAMSMVVSIPSPVDPPPAPEPDWLRVIVKWPGSSIGGSDGSASSIATWAYDLYWPHDADFQNKLTASPVEPENSRARYMEGKVAKAADGSSATAYRASDGTIKLWDISEKRVKGACS